MHSRHNHMINYTIIYIEHRLLSVFENFHFGILIVLFMMANFRDKKVFRTWNFFYYLHSNISKKKYIPSVTKKDIFISSIYGLKNNDVFQIIL